MTGTPDAVRIEVDPAVCVGIGACELAAAQAIAVGGDGVARPAGVVLARDAAAALRDVCPSGALRVVDDQ
jgi:ferredoxin